MEIDISLLDDLLAYVRGTNSGILDAIIQHPAAVKTYNHAVRFGNTTQTMRSFWESILETKRSQSIETLVAAESSLSHLRQNRDMYEDLFNELEMYLPDGCDLETVLYAIIGYDVGIVSEGSAIVNFAHSWFRKDPREIPFMAMHELHHVGFTSYNPIFKMNDVKTITDLLEVIRYATHLEGLAVHAPLQKRIESGVLGNTDYRVLLDTSLRDRRVTEYFVTVNNLEQEGHRPLVSNDLEVLEDMSGRNRRLWYIAGAHMAMRIDEELGRRALVQTIVDGPDAFFDSYNTVV